MKKPTFEGLEKYVHRGGTQCLVCKSPYLEWIREAKEKGFALTTISKYLYAELDCKISRGSLRNHFDHHERQETIN